MPVVLFAMALTSAMVVGGVYVARVQGSAARMARSSTGLHASLEQVLAEKVTNWDTGGRSAAPIGAVVVEASAMVDGVLVATTVRRLSPETYWFVAEAVSSSSLGIQGRLGMLVHSQAGRIRPVPGAPWARIP